MFISNSWLYMKTFLKKYLVKLINFCLRNSELLTTLEKEQRDTKAFLGTLNSTQDSLQAQLNLLLKINLSKSLKKIKLGFLVHNIEAWSSLEEVYYAALKDEAFEPLVFSLNRKYAGEIFRDEEKIHKVLQKKGIPHIRLNQADSFLDLDIVRRQEVSALFRQSHWLPDLPPAFHPRYLTFSNLYYLPYELAVLPAHGLEFRYSLYETLCSKVFLVSEEVKTEMARLPNADKVRAIVSGHPKVQALIKKSPDVWPILSNNKTRIIWSAHHSYGHGWNDFGVFDLVFESMLVFAQTHPQWDILFSPHPALIHKLENIQEKAFSEKVKDFFKIWKNLPNTGTIEMGDYFGPFHSSSLLIVDGVSFLYEYQLLEKPVIKLTRNDSSPLTEFGNRALQGVHKLPVENFSELERKVENLLNHPDTLKPFQKKLKEEMTRVKDPAQLILDEIKKDFI